MTSPSRRTFLQAGAALSIGGAVGSCARHETRVTGAIVDTDVANGHRLLENASSARDLGEEKVPVLIAGGGVAGLSAAWRLRRAGFEDLAVLELGNAAGGTARGGSLKGIPHPWGAHYLPVPRRSQRALVAFLEDAGIGNGFDDDGRLQVPRTHLVRAPQERLYHLGVWDEGLWLAAGATAQDHEELARFETLLDELNVPDDRGRRAFELPLASSSDRHRDLDGRSAASWADEHGLRGERIRNYLEYATRDDYGAGLADTSAWALVHYFTARTTPGSDVSGEYMTWPDGNQFLVNALTRELDSRLRPGSLVVAVEPRGAGSAGATVRSLDLSAGGIRTYHADQVILALPQFVIARVLAEDPARESRARFRYSPWVVANVFLSGRPRSVGFPDAWDNVIYSSESLGFIDATHQLDRASSETVWTWYLPFLDPNETASRRAMLARTWEEWRDLVLADLRFAFADVDDHVERIDVWRWGHAMVKPYPGFLFGADRELAATPFGGVHFAHSDVGGLPLFEEAHWAGTRAAEEVLEERGIASESLLA